MAFPDDRLVHRLEAAFGADADASPGTWTWTDITADINAQRITINRGQANESGEPTPTSVRFVLDNVSGDYTPGNALGAHYPDIDLGVPLRYSVKAGAPRLVIEAAGGRATTPDDAALDISGSIDVRVEISLDDWASGQPIELAGKYSVTGDQRSWLLLYGAQRDIHFRWSEDGASFVFFGSTESVPVPASGRIALRSTLDASNRVVTHYTAPSIDGPWTQLGDTSPSGAATSLFNSDQPLEVGDVSGIGFTAPQGSIYAVELRDGIDGVVVASPDFTTLDDGTTEFTDSAGRAWTITSAAHIDNWHARFIGNVDSWDPVWPYGDLSETDSGYAGESQVTVTASGILRRLGQGAQPLHSTLRRRIATAPQVVAYWPMEDGKDATEAASPLGGVAPLRLTGVQWAAGDGPPGSDALPTLDEDAVMRGRIPPGAEYADGWQLEMVYNLDNLPASESVMLEVVTTGRPWRRLQVVVTSNAIRIYGIDDTGNTSSISQLINVLPVDVTGQWTRLGLMARSNGGDVDLRLRWVPIGGDGEEMNTTYTGSAGVPTSIDTRFGADLKGMGIGHLSVLSAFESTLYNNADTGFNGESAADRMTRLCQEESIAFALTGHAADTEPMGPQRPVTLASLLTEAAAVDGGVLGEQRAAFGLQYRTRVSLYNQTPALSMDARANGIANPFAPVLDDQRLRNDITVSRDGGSSARVTDEASIRRRRRYKDSVTLNAHTDDQLPSLAGWRLHLGTWPGMRYPSVSTDLTIAPQLIDNWLALDYGDRIQAVNLPPQHPAGTVDLLMRGYSETLSPTRWSVQANCTPAGPWQIAHVPHDGDEGNQVSRVDTDGCQLAADLATGQTQAIVRITDGLAWTTDAAEMPWDITVGGEVMTVMEAGEPVADTFDRTTSDGWGTSSSGHTWTVDGPDSASFSVDAGQGRIDIGSVPDSYWAVTGPEAADAEITMGITTDALAQGGSQYAGAALRSADAFLLREGYVARLEVRNDGWLILQIWKHYNGSISGQGDEYVVTSSYIPGRYYYVRHQAVGTTVRARAWAEDEPEPDTWHVTVTDADLTSGQAGVWAALDVSNTNTLPVRVSVADLSTDTQTLTVTRGTNGIDLDHDTGTDVRLADPAIVAL